MSDNRRDNKTNSHEVMTDPDRDMTKIEVDSKYGSRATAKVKNLNLKPSISTSSHVETSSPTISTKETSLYQYYPRPDGVSGLRSAYML